ncbi:MAG: hypothetical protein DRR08_17645 [Candidatus Parabeggiatoa sp. nov. 2]|nr:MAG: hypothetical protein B6247_27295 [Beggiatoa sp. 4572_84]RKZ57969.1 MAG: hypothetical protein DRR08_17645 [Gammaproteobacteria bacterium]
MSTTNYADKRIEYNETSLWNAYIAPKRIRVICGPGCRINSVELNSLPTFRGQPLVNFGLSLVLCQDSIDTLWHYQTTTAKLKFGLLVVQTAPFVGDLSPSSFKLLKRFSACCDVQDKSWTPAFFRLL